MSAALKKVALENAARKGKKTKQGDEDLDVKAMKALVHNLKSALEQLVTFVGKEENICPKVGDIYNWV